MYKRDFFERPSRDVARSLLGAGLIHHRVGGAVAGYIVETEAYGDETDSASHARFGKTPRTGPLFGPPGHAYVYLIYGIHTILNIVTGREGDAGAVLIRAVVDPQSQKLHDGPGRVGKHLSIAMEHNRLDVTGGEPLGVERGFSPEPHMIITGQRVGVHYAHRRDREAALRFRLADIAALARYLQGE